MQQCFDILGGGTFYLYLVISLRNALLKKGWRV